MSLDRLESLQTKINSTTALLKIPDLQKKMEQLGEEMSAPNFWSDQARAQTISQDYQSIKSEVDRWQMLSDKVQELIELAKTSDDSLKDEISAQTEALEKEFSQYEFFLLLNGPYDQNNAIVSIHAGSGGTEAQDWAEMLLRMVFRFCEKQGWSTKVIDESRGAEAGYKSITFEVTGRYAYGYLKSEHGVHRLVRISPFDAEKMRHTSFALIEVLPEISEAIQGVLWPSFLPREDAGGTAKFSSPFLCFASASARFGTAR